MANSNYLKMIRESKNLSIKDVSSDTKIQVQTLKSYEDGSKISIEHLEKLSIFFKVSPSFILSGKDRKYQFPNYEVDKKFRKYYHISVLIYIFMSAMNLIWVSINGYDSINGNIQILLTIIVFIFIQLWLYIFKGVSTIIRVKYLMRVIKVITVSLFYLFFIHYAQNSSDSLNLIGFTLPSLILGYTIIDFISAILSFKYPVYLYILKSSRLGLILMGVYVCFMGVFLTFVRLTTLPPDLDRVLMFNLLISGIYVVVLNFRWINFRIKNNLYMRTYR